MFVDRRKLKAAATSLHQYYPAVRALFPRPVREGLVESVAVMLYLRAARDRFGRRFVDRLTEILPEYLRHASPEEVHTTRERIAERAATFEGANDQLLADGARATAFEHHVRGVVRALLQEAGLATDDADLVRDTYMPLMEASSSIEAHLEGIQQQNPFMMRR